MASREEEIVQEKLVNEGKFKNDILYSEY